MNKILAFGFWSIIFSNIIYGELDKVNLESYDNFIGKCMGIWTKIDLIQAINTTDEQRETTIKKLLVLINDVYQESKNLELVLNLLNSFEMSSLLSLVESVLMSFQEVFYDIDNEYSFQAMAILTETINFLKTPSNIKAIITA